MSKSPEQFSKPAVKNPGEEKPKEEIWEKIRRKTKERMAQIRLLEKEGNVEQARKDRYEFWASMLKMQGIKPRDIIDVRLFPKEVSNFEGADRGEFIELTQDEFVIHSPGDDIDISIPLEEIVDIDCIMPSGKREINKLENL